MTELYQLPPGQDIAPGLPPVELPTIAAPPQQPLRITVTPHEKSADPWAAFPDAAPSNIVAPEKGGDAWSAFPDQPPPAQPPPAPDRDIGTAEALGRGSLNALSFGFAPAIAGLAEASGMPSSAEAPGSIDTNPVRPIVGAAKLLHSYLSDHPDPNVQDAYQRGREAALSDDRMVQEQHPSAYIAGQLAGTLATLPIGGGLGLIKGATVLPRIGRAIQAGALGGGLYGAGEATSEGQSPGSVATGAGLGALTGAALGGLGGGIAEGVGSIGSRIGRLFRGATDVDTEAGRQVARALQRDFDHSGPAFTPEQLTAGTQAGLPATLMDAGGQATRDLARTAGNISSEAWDALQGATQNRFQNVSPRVAGYIRRVTGGPIAADDAAALSSAASRANSPAYRRAYAAGSSSLFSPEIERLTSSPAVEKAMAGAAARGQDRAVAEGLGGFNPKVNVTPDGRVLFNKGPTGVPTYPDLQFWDYTQRELRDAANAAQRSGRNEEAGALFKLHSQLTTELDRAVPAFKAARATAASFFKADNALEAGQNFVMQNADVHAARRALGKMSDPERMLFARGFASELADKVMKIGDNQSVLNRIFIDSHLARQKIAMALGPVQAKQIEALLRAESIVDRARTNLGNSTTARQLKQMALSGAHGVGGAGAVAAFEAVKEHDFEPSHLIGAALVVGSIRHGAHVIDEKVARRIGEMLVSHDPAILAKGLEIVTRNPTLFNALRAVTGAGARVGAHDIGPTGAAAGAAAGIQYLLREGDQHQPHPSDYLMDPQQPQ